MKRILCLLTTLACSLPALAQNPGGILQQKAASDFFPGNHTALVSNDAAASQNQTDQNKPTKKVTQAAEAPESGDRYVYKTVDGIVLPLYVFQPNQTRAHAKRPAIVFFFGGGWSSGNPSQFEKQCEHFASRGMVAVTVEYRVSSRHSVKIDDCIEDAKSAMRWVRAHAKDLSIDPDRIAAAGGSAGGHLAACTAVIDKLDASLDDKAVSAKPNAMVLFNPALAIAWDERMPKEVREIAQQKMSGRSHVPIKDVSPLTYASTKQPPCIMFFGTADRLLEGARLYQMDSQKANNICEIITYEEQGHGFFNRGEYYDLTLAAADTFFVDCGWLSKP